MGRTPLPPFLGLWKRGGTLGGYGTGTQSDASLVRSGTASMWSPDVCGGALWEGRARHNITYLVASASTSLCFWVAIGPVGRAQPAYMKAA